MNTKTARDEVTSILSSAVYWNKLEARNQLLRAKEIMERFGFWHEKDWCMRWLKRWRDSQLS